MKFLIVALACITMAAADPTVKTWTLDELSEAIQRNKTDPELMPHLEDALNQIMLVLFTGVNEESVQALIRSPDGGSKWTKEELEQAIQDPETNPSYRNFFRSAYHYLEYNKSEKTIEVTIPALDISTWTMPDLEKAINDRSTNPELLVHLVKARDELKKESDKRNKITIVTQVGLIQTNESSLISRKSVKIED